MLRAPVALFAFNRPETTARVFEAVRAARPPRLFLICDGPRADREAEAERCAEVRHVLEGVDWPCAVERNYADANLGCRARISSGIAWVFSRTEEAIFLEDDTLPDASFFPYCDELLERFARDDRVMMVCGYNALSHRPRGSSYWFSAHPRIWGWASWRRAWAGYDVTMAAWPAAKATPAWTTRSPLEQRLWEQAFDAVKAGAIDTWDAQVSLHTWTTGRLCVIPATNLVANLGFGPSATNTHAAEFPGPAVRPLTLPLVHARQVSRDVGLDAKWVRREMAPGPGSAQRLLRRAITWVRGR